MEIVSPMWRFLGRQIGMKPLVIDWATEMRKWPESFVIFMFIANSSISKSIMSIFCFLLFFFFFSQINSTQGMLLPNNEFRKKIKFYSF